jgi:hypothetical protein
MQHVLQNLSILMGDVEDKMAIMEAVTGAIRSSHGTVQQGILLHMLTGQRPVLF